MGILISDSSVLQRNPIEESERRPVEMCAGMETAVSAPRPHALSWP
jgi:hypothetical protein